jgi:transposase
MDFRRGKDRHQIYMTSMDQLVESDSWARVVDLFVDALPIAEFGFRHSQLNKEGNLPYHPSDLFKLLLYGYRHGIRSSAKLAKACKINVEVVWLLKGLQPSPRTINYFRQYNTKAIEKAHRHFVRLLREWKMMDGETIALDGTKVRAQNSKKNNFNARKIERHLEYIEGKINGYLEALSQLEDSPRKGRRQRQQIQELEDKVDQLEERAAAYEALGEQVAQSEDGQVSTSDPDARAVVLHRNIVEVGYNIQATVDSKHNIVVDVFTGGVNDLNELSRAAKRFKEITGIDKADILADKGYHNGVELARSERLGIRPYVAPKEQHSSSLEGFRKQDFIYNKDRDSYTCPTGEELITNGTKYRKQQKKSYRFKRYANYVACQNCPLKSQCTTREAGRLIERPVHQAYIDRNHKRVTQDYWYYRQRQQIVEPVFGTWKRYWGMDYTLVKGHERVATEYRLAAICTNLWRSVSVKGLAWVKKRLERLKKALFGADGLMSLLERLVRGERAKIVYLKSTVLALHLRLQCA